MVQRELRELANITGIENKEGATNLPNDKFGRLARDDLAKRISLAVIRQHKESGDESNLSAEGTGRITDATYDVNTHQQDSVSGKNDLAFMCQRTQTMLS